MTDQTMPTPESTTGKREPFAPWATFRAYDPTGFNISFSLSTDTAGELVDNIQKLTNWLSEYDWAPAYGYGAPTGAPAQMPQNGQRNGASVAAQANGGAVPVCPSHGTPMKPSQHGGHFCPTKIADDNGAGKPVYCKHQVKAVAG